MGILFFLDWVLSGAKRNLEKNFLHCVKKNEIKKVAELLISNYKRNRLKVDQFLFPSNSNEYYFLAISCIEVISL